MRACVCVRAQVGTHASGRGCYVLSLSMESLSGGLTPRSLEEKGPSQGPRELSPERKVGQETFVPKASCSWRIQERQAAGHLPGLSLSYSKRAQIVSMQLRNYQKVNPPM